MSAYEVNLLCRRVLREPELCGRLGREPEATLEAFELTDAERQALLAGDVARLYALGAHEYMLMGLARRGVLGLDIPTFIERIRQAEPHFNY